MRFDFIKVRFAYYIFAILLVIISIGAYFTLPLNLGIDMTGGVQIEYDYTIGQIETSVIREVVENIKKEILYNGSEIINNINVYKIS
jgi:preprotein translocase subunit SecF